MSADPQDGAGPARFPTYWPDAPAQVELTVHSVRAGVEVLEVRGDIDLAEAGAVPAG